MFGITDIAHPRRFLPDRDRAAMLGVLAYQGLTLAINGVAAPWVMSSFGLDQAGLARVFAWVSLSALGTFVLARQADRAGRRTMLISSMTVGSMAAVGAASSTTLPFFVLFNIVLLSASGAAVTCAFVWMAEASSRDTRASWQGMAGLAVVLGSGPCILLMPWLARTALSWRALFLLSASAIVILPLIPRDAPLEEPVDEDQSRPTGIRLSLFTDRALRPRALVLLATTVLSPIATSTVDSWRYVHAVGDVGLAPEVASVLLLASGFLGLAGFTAGAYASDGLGRIRTAAGALTLMTLGIAWSFWGPPAGHLRPWLWLASGFATTTFAGNAITVASNTAITELFPAKLRATMFGGLYLAGSLGRVAAQTLVAAMAPRLGAVAPAVGALALAGLPAALLLVWLLPDTLDRRSEFASRPLSSPAPGGLRTARSSGRRVPPSLAARLGLAAFVSIGGLLALEGTVRWLAPRALMVPWQDDISGITAPKPRVSGRFAIAGRFDTTVTFRDRFRSRRPVAMGPAPGTMRAAVLGDSCTFGWGADDDEAYPAVLERTLNTAGVASEVLNAGVIGTGTGEQALWYDVWVRQFNPSLVILSVFWNDVDDDVRGAMFVQEGDRVVPRSFDVLTRGLSSVRRTRALANATPGFAWLSQHSELLSWLRQAPTDWLAAAHARAMGASVDGVAIDAFRSQALELWQGEIRWLRDRLPATTTLAIVFLPSAEWFDRGRPGAGAIVAKSTTMVNALQQLTADLGVPFLDVTQALERDPDPRRLFFALDPHPNPDGYRAIGESIAAFLGPLQLPSPSKANRP